MKFTQKTLIETLRDMEEGKGAYQARKRARVSVGRVYQVWNEYKKTGRIPEIGKKSGRPKKKISKNEEKLIKDAYNKYFICASRLRRFIQRDYNVDIPHYNIHKVLLKYEMASSHGRKDVRKKKWIRYERRHSLTAVHIDWAYDDKEERWFMPVLDDSSRKLLSLTEVESATTDASIEGMKEAMKHGEIQQCISDHGTQFCKGADDKARFPAFLEKHSIKQILCRIKHPQSNGKLEKFNHIYKIHRHRYKTKEEFIYWYNNIKPHMSLDERTPEEVYQERKKEGRKYFT